ncbi:MAG: AMP-binding protein [Pseudomonadota bacterium]
MSAWPPVYDPTYHPAPDEPYWNRAVETMDDQEREQTVILPKLKAQLDYCYKHSPFYKKKWDAAGVNPADMRSLTDFEKFPLVTKDEIRADQAAHPPFGSNVCIDPMSMGRVLGTSGTTGRPTAFGVSKADMVRIANAHARIMWGMGIRQDDIVFIGSFFSLYWGSWGALVGTERLGATAFPFGAGVPGQTERAIEWMQMVRPTVFYGTPSYSLYLAERARSMGVDPRKDFNFRILFFSGEPGAGVPATKKRIEETYGALCMDSGSTGEMSPWMTDGECSERRGMHLWQDIVYAELVDLKTNRRVPYGSEGVTVYTHLERDSQPMIRFLAGDISRWETGACACGRTYPRLPRGIYGRADDMFVVRGENVYPSAIEDELRAIEGFGDEYRIVITRERTMDELIVQAEPVAGVDEAGGKAIARQLADKLKAKGLRTVVQMMAPGTLARTEFKAKRIVDQRNLYEELVQGQ